MKTFYWVLLVLLLFIITYWNTLRLSLIFYLTIHRGLVAPNCFWWSVSDALLTDSAGINLARDLERQNPNKSLIRINMWGTPIFMVSNPKYMKLILDNSPFIFGPGLHKSRFFHSFMKDNVGVSKACPWKYRRALNEHVLDSGQSHQLLPLYYKDIDKIMTRYPYPRNHEEFTVLGKKLAGLVIFNDPNPSPAIFDILTESNTPWSMYITPNQPSMKPYRQYIHQQLSNPKQHSMIEMGKQFGASNYEMLHQIPHWIFPIAGLLIVLAPRTMILICNTPRVYQRVKQNPDPVYIRNCVMETLRLNNQVITLSRTLMRNYTFPNGETLKKGDQVVIFPNPVMRGQNFVDPEAFVPERWNDLQLEKTYTALMFSQGPQKCPGKELALDLAVYFLTYIFRNYSIIGCKPKIDTNNVPQMINPCKVEFVYHSA